MKYLFNNFNEITKDFIKYFKLIFLVLFLSLFLGGIIFTTLLSNLNLLALRAFSILIVTAFITFIIWFFITMYLFLKEALTKYYNPSLSYRRGILIAFGLIFSLNFLVGLLSPALGITTFLISAIANAYILTNFMYQVKEDFAIKGAVVLLISVIYQIASIISLSIILVVLSAFLLLLANISVVLSVIIGLPILIITIIFIASLFQLAIFTNTINYLKK